MGIWRRKEIISCGHLLRANLGKGEKITSYGRFFLGERDNAKRNEIGGRRNHSSTFRVRLEQNGGEQCATYGNTLFARLSGRFNFDPLFLAIFFDPLIMAFFEPLILLEAIFKKGRFFPLQIVPLRSGILFLSDFNVGRWRNQVKRYGEIEKAMISKFEKAIVSPVFSAFL